MEGNDDFLGDMPSMPDMENFNMESFDMNMDFNMDDFPEMPSFNDSFNLEDFEGGDMTADLQNFEDMNSDESEGETGFEEDDVSQEGASQEEDEEIHDEENFESEDASDESMTPQEYDNDENGGEGDGENNCASSGKFPEDSDELDKELIKKNEELLLAQSRRKKSGIDLLPLRDPESTDSSQETMMRPRKSNLKKGKAENKTRKSVEFATPIEKVSRIESRKSVGSKKKYDRRLVDEEDEPFVKEIKEFLNKPRSQSNLDVLRHRRVQQGMIENFHSKASRLDTKKMVAYTSKKTEVRKTMINLEKIQGETVAKVAGLEPFQNKAKASVRKLEQRWENENENFDNLRKQLPSAMTVRQSQVSLRISVAGKNLILEQMREAWIKKREDHQRRKLKVREQIKSAMTMLKQLGAKN